MKNYRKLFKEANINTVEAKKALRKLRIVKIYQYVINIIFGIPWLAGLYMYNTVDGSFSDPGSFFGFLGGATLFIYAPLFIVYSQLRDSSIGRLEQIYFDEFLCKQLKIFYSPVEANDYEYETIKEITVTKNQNFNQRQALITTCEQAYHENADGIIVLNYDTASVTTGDISKKSGGTIQTNVIGTASARLIKNIIEKKTNNKNDLDYWYNLLQKGAISEQEYDDKKKEIL